MSPGNSVWAALLWDCSPTFLLWACRERRLYLHSLQFCLFLVDHSSLNSVFSNQSSLQLGRITEILLWLRILEIQTESFSNQYLLRYSRKKKTTMKCRYSRWHFWFMEFQAREGIFCFSICPWSQRVKVGHGLQRTGKIPTGTGLKKSFILAVNTITPSGPQNSSCLLVKYSPTNSFQWPLM